MNLQPRGDRRLCWPPALTRDDSTMVAWSALQNAASIAKKILMTEAIVAEPPETAGAGIEAGAGVDLYGRRWKIIGDEPKAVGASWRRATVTGAEHLSAN